MFGKHPAEQAIFACFIVATLLLIATNPDAQDFPDAMQNLISQKLQNQSKPRISVGHSASLVTTTLEQGLQRKYCALYSIYIPDKSISDILFDAQVRSKTDGTLDDLVLLGIAGGVVPIASTPSQNGCLLIWESVVETIVWSFLRPKVETLPLPPGWHALPLSIFRKTEDYHFRLKDSSGALQASGDFDGDGKKDIARVLQSDDGHHCAVFLTNSQNGVVTHYNALQFDTGCTEGQAASVFVYIEPAGTSIETWCGKTGECDDGEQKSLKLIRPGIDVGVFEVGYSTFYWDSESRSWKSVDVSE